MRARGYGSSRKLGRGLEQSPVRFQSSTLVYPEGVNLRRIREWQSMGELGQYLAGLAAGYSPQEIAKNREWSKQQFRNIVTEAATLIDQKDSDGTLRRGPR